MLWSENAVISWYVVVFVFATVKHFCCCHCCYVGYFYAHHRLGRFFTSLAKERFMDWWSEFFLSVHQITDSIQQSRAVTDVLTGYGKTITHVIIGLKTAKGTKQLKLDPSIYESLQKEKVEPGDVIYIEANSGAVKVTILLCWLEWSLTSHSTRNKLISEMSLCRQTVAMALTSAVEYGHFGSWSLTLTYSS